jgi:hypothetical protein
MCLQSGSLYTYHMALLYDFSFHFPLTFFLSGTWPIRPNSTSFEYSLDFSPVNNSYGDFLFSVLELMFSISFALLTASAHNKFLASSSKLAAHHCAWALWIICQSSFNNTILLWVFVAVFSMWLLLHCKSVLQIGFLLLDHLRNLTFLSEAVRCITKSFTCLPIWLFTLPKYTQLNLE